MSGTLINTGGGGWMQLAPGEYVPGITPAPPPTTYDMWGRPVGGSPTPAASGAGLGNLYNTVSNTMAQQQMPANAPNLMGIGSSGYDQWGRQAPPAAGAGAARSSLDPMNQSIVDAIASGQPQQGAMLAQILGGSVTPPTPENGGWGGGRGYGLLGAAAGGNRAEEAGGGMAGVESSASNVSSDPNIGGAEQQAGADTSNAEDENK